MRSAPPSVHLAGRALEDWLRRIATNREFAEVANHLGAPHDFRQVATKLLSMEGGTNTSEHDLVLKLYRQYVVH